MHCAQANGSYLVFLRTSGVSVAHSDLNFYWKMLLILYSG